MKKPLLISTSGALILCFSLVVPGYADNQKKAAEPRAIATVTPDSSWGSDQDESNHLFTCGAEGSGSTGYVMIARRHSDDENGWTGYRCAKLDQNGELDGPIEATRHQNTPEDGVRFVCPPGKVIIGRERYGDETADEYFTCAVFLDQWNRHMEVAQGKWSDEYSEAGHTYTCPTNSVLIGKYHDDDENGPTAYLCGTLW